MSENIEKSLKIMASVRIKIADSISGARWMLADCDQTTLSRLEQETGEDRILLQCLVNRGLSTADQIKKFLTPNFESHLYPPMLLRDMPQAVERLRGAIRNRERILIVTDFDVDGTTSSVIIAQTLK